MSLVLDLSADAGTYQDAGLGTPATANNSPVAGWSGGGGAVTTSGGSPPVLKTGVLNGLPVVRFSSSGDPLAGLSLSAEPITLMHVASATDSGTGVMVLAGDPAGGFKTYKPSGSPAVYRADQSDIVGLGDTTLTYAINVFRLVTVTWNGTTLKWFVAGVAAGTATPGAVGLSGSGIVLGGDGEGSTFNSDFAALKVWDTAIDDTTRTAAEASLASKWAVAGGASANGAAMYHHLRNMGVYG